MNAYDAAHQTVKAIQEGHEYKKLLAAKTVLAEDTDADKMVRDFLKKQTQLQLEAMSGRAIDKEKQDQLQKLSELITLNSKAREYVQAYMRFQLMMEDIYKIFGDAIKPVISDMKDE